MMPARMLALIGSLDSERVHLVVLSLVIPLVFAGIWWAARVRDRVPGIPRVLEEPPESLHPVDLSMLWSSYHHHRSPRTASRAEILHLARTGAISIIPRGTVSAPGDLELHLLAEPVDETDRRFVSFLFADGEHDRVLLSELRSGGPGGQALLAWWGEGLSRVGGSLQDMLIDLRGGALAGFVVLVASMAAVATVAPDLPELGALPAVPFLVAAAGWLLLVVALPARLGQAERRRMQGWAAFRRYLRNFPSVRESPAAGIVVWERYLEDAAALGVAGKVERQIRGFPLPAPWLGAPGGNEGASLFRHLWHHGPRHGPADHAEMA